MFNGEQGHKQWRISCGCKAAGGGIRTGLRPDNQHLHDANTSAASVPLALDVAVRDGRIKAGDVIVIEAMGGGFTWGASVVRM